MNMNDKKIFVSIFGMIMIIMCIGFVNAADYSAQITADNPEGANTDWYKFSGIEFKTNIPDLEIRNVGIDVTSTAPIIYIINSTEDIICKFVTDVNTVCRLSDIGTYYVLAGTIDSGYTESYGYMNNAITSTTALNFTQGIVNCDIGNSNIGDSAYFDDNGCEKKLLNESDSLRNIEVINLRDTPTYPNMTSGLYAYWNLDEEIGTVAYDILGLYDGITVADVTFNQTGIVNHSLKFDSSVNPSFVNMNITSSFNMQDGFTENVWSNEHIVNGYGHDTITAIGVDDMIANPSNRTFIAHNLDSNMWVNVCNNYAEDTGISVNADEWNMWTITYDGTYGGIAYIYHNGINVLNITVEDNRNCKNDIASAQIMSVGRALGYNPIYNARIDEIGLWTRQLSAEEVSDLWNNGSGMSYPFEAPEFCDESWIPNNTACNGFNYTIQYYDFNNCGTFNELPIDNGTIVDCTPQNESSITAAVVTNVTTGLTSVFVIILIVTVIISIGTALLSSFGVIESEMMIKVISITIIACALLMVLIAMKMFVLV